MKPTPDMVEINGKQFAKQPDGRYKAATQSALQQGSQIASAPSKGVERKETAVSDGYDSDLERDFAQELEFWKRTDEIEHWEREPERIKIAKRGNKWWTMEPDFKVLRKGEIEWYECKPTPDATKKMPAWVRLGELKLSLFASYCKLWHQKLYRTTKSQGRFCYEELA